MNRRIVRCIVGVAAFVAIGLVGCGDDKKSTGPSGGGGCSGSNCQENIAAKDAGIDSEAKCKQAASLANEEIKKSMPSACISFVSFSNGECKTKVCY